LRGIGKAIRGIHIAVEGYDFSHAVKGAEFALERCQQGERTGAGCCVAFFDGAVETCRSGNEAVRAGGDCAGEVDDVSHLLGRDIVSAGSRSGREFVTERGEDLFW